tara:strand:+ start:132 stop:494 length:363 start_codon:yes stop_codon:yes gene_type:complete
MSERPIIKVDKDGKIRQTGKTRLKDGTIRVQPEGGMKFIPNKKDGGLMEAIDKVKAKEMQGGGLTGGQKKLDKNKDGKISGEDFKILRNMELGGPVKMGSGGGVCRGMGAARAGGKFKLR